MWLGRDNFDLGERPDQRLRPFGEHGLHVGRPSDDLALAPARFLEQDLEPLSDGPPVEGLPLIFDELLKRREPLGFGWLVNLARHFGGGSAGAGRIFEGITRGEPHRSNESEL